MSACAPAWSQVVGAPLPWLGQNFFNLTGVLLPGGKLCSYQAGTTTPLATWNDRFLTVPNMDPLVLGSDGRPQTSVFLAGVAYKFVLRTAGTDTTCSTGTVVWTLDNQADSGLLLLTLNDVWSGSQTFNGGVTVSAAGGTGTIVMGKTCLIAAQTSQTQNCLTMNVATGSEYATIEMQGQPVNLGDSVSIMRTLASVGGVQYETFKARVVNEPVGLPPTAGNTTGIYTTFHRNGNSTGTLADQRGMQTDGRTWFFGKNPNDSNANAGAIINDNSAGFFELSASSIALNGANCAALVPFFADSCPLYNAVLIASLDNTDRINIGTNTGLAVAQGVYLNTAGPNQFNGSVDQLSSNAAFGWSTNTDAGTGSMDVALTRQSAGVLNFSTGTEMLFPNGSAANPAVGGRNFTNSGLYFPGGGAVALAANGIEAMGATSTTVGFTSGSTAAPSISFLVANTTGLSEAAGPVINFSNNGTNTVRLDQFGTWNLLTDTINVATGGSTTISTGVGSVKMSTANPATNTTWIPIRYNGAVVYVPGWLTNAP